MVGRRLIPHSHQYCINLPDPIAFPGASAHFLRHSIYYSHLGSRGQAYVRAIRQNRPGPSSQKGLGNEREIKRQKACRFRRTDSCGSGAIIVAVDTGVAAKLFLAKEDDQEFNELMRRADFIYPHAVHFTAGALK